MTRSWEAFDRVPERASTSWQRYAVQSGEQDPDALTQAIRSFRAAVGVDPAFALAHYRLGLALQKDGQPFAAAEALRTSLKANPGFVPARVALASVLYGAREPSARDVARPDRAIAARDAAGARYPAAGASSPRSRRGDAGSRSGAYRRAARAPCSTKPAFSGSPWSRPTSRRLAARPGGGVGGAVPACVRARCSGRRAWAREARRPPAGYGRREPDHDCSTWPTSIASRPTASTPRSSTRDAEDVRLRTARASVLASIGLLLEQHGPPGRSPRRGRVAVLGGRRRARDARAGRPGDAKRSRGPLHQACAPLLSARARAPPGRHGAPVSGSDGRTGLWNPGYRDDAAHAGPGERLDGAPRPGRLLPRPGPPVSGARPVSGLRHASPAEPGAAPRPEPGQIAATFFESRPRRVPGGVEA